MHSAGPDLDRVHERCSEPAVAGMCSALHRPDEGRTPDCRVYRRFLGEHGVLRGDLLP